MNTKNTVFVNLPHPNPIPTPEAGLRQWQSAAVGFAKDLTPTLNPKSAVVSTEEPTKMLPEQHQDDRFLTGIKATLKISGKWETAPSVFSQYYDKYNIVELRDIETGLDGLAKADEIQSKVVDGEKQYFLPTSDFERLLNRCQVSRYHLTAITRIDEAVICGYCKGAKIDTADAHKIADKLNLELSDFEGMVIEPETPTIEQLFEKALPVHIEGSSLGTLYRSRSRVSCFQWHDFSISRSL